MSLRTLLTPGSMRNAVSWAIEDKGHSQRRACALVGIDPRVYPCMVVSDNGTELTSNAILAGQDER